MAKDFGLGRNDNFQQLGIEVRALRDGAPSPDRYLEGCPLP
jgi:hypothetical protein